jgi:hypothetical protein
MRTPGNFDGKSPRRACSAIGNPKSLMSPKYAIEQIVMSDQIYTTWYSSQVIEGIEIGAQNLLFDVSRRASARDRCQRRRKGRGRGRKCCGPSGVFSLDHESYQHLNLTDDQGIAGPLLSATPSKFDKVSYIAQQSCHANVMIIVEKSLVVISLMVSELSQPI